MPLLTLRHFSQPVSVTIALLKTLRVKVTRTTVNETLQNHPDYPSLLSISDSLKKWHIDNVALEVQPKQLPEFQLPFIAVLDKGSFVLVTKINERVTYQTGIANRTSVILEKEEFLERWNGIVLKAEAVAQSGEKNYKQVRKKELLNIAKTPFLLLIPVLVSLFAIQNNNWTWAFSLFLLYVHSCYALARC